jgi:hypothetical protein
MIHIPLMLRHLPDHHRRFLLAPVVSNKRENDELAPEEPPAKCHKKKHNTGGREVSKSKGVPKLSQ